MDVSQHTAYRDYEWAIELNRLSLTLLGVWPENHETKQKKLMSDIRVIISFNLLTWICLIPSLHSLLKIYDDIMSTIDNLQYTLPLLMAMIKLFIIWQKKYDILPILNMIKDDWLRPKTSEERNIMIKQARIARLLTIFGCFMMLLSAIFALVLPLFGISMRYRTNRTDPDKSLPLQTHYIYDKDKSPFFEITYVLQCIAVTLIGVMYSCTDSFLSLLVFHVCGQLVNLKERLIDLDKFQDFRNALSYNIRDHMRLIRSINIIDNVFTIMLLGALLYFGILFAFYGFLFGTMFSQGRNLSVTRLTFILIVSLNTFMHMFLYCVLGEILFAQCEAVYHAAYEYKWYTLEPKKARNILMIMIRANKPLYLTAGKLFPMTMAMFCNLLKTSGGYISVLLAHRE
ncbi:ObirOr5-U59 [Ooceraea biroi]|uniref:Odorant receptor n=1 Tax=Ooceraea biroi TaxID=2015173 RepID=A0A3L8DLL2_OOCBI|nr:odorant receptor 43a-like isoform X2 [Ooceraea biroi]RLU20799.1 ObirOr5-U59 [Ooceraea biroi]